MNRKLVSEAPEQTTREQSEEPTQKLTSTVEVNSSDRSHEESSTVQKASK